MVKDPKPITILDDENVLTIKEINSPNFKFENDKLADVLQRISESYGIDIIVSNESVYKCVFSGDVTKQNLFDKLNIISVATGLSYEVSGTKILIKGNGCK